MSPNAPEVVEPYAPAEIEAVRPILAGLPRSLWTAIDLRIARWLATVDALRAERAPTSTPPDALRGARIESALREIAASGPDNDPCSDEYDADGKRRDGYGRECAYCTFESDEPAEVASHAAARSLYGAAYAARAALSAPAAGPCPGEDARDDAEARARLAATPAPASPAPGRPT